MQNGEEDEQNPEEDEDKTIDAIEIRAKEEEEENDDESHRRPRLEIQKSAEIASREKSADKRRRKT